MIRYFQALLLAPLLFLGASPDSAQSRSSNNSETTPVTASAKEERSAPSNDNSTNKSAINDPLIRLLISKGLLSAEEGRAIVSGPPAEQQGRLAALLKNKGLISAAEFESLRTPE